jgi:trimethylamine:corrinoid methyltransferase-like protein
MMQWHDVQEQFRRGNAGLDAPAALPALERQTPDALLARYEEPPLPNATAEALAAFVEERKHSAIAG